MTAQKPASRFARDLLHGRDPYTALVALTRTIIQAALAFGAALVLGAESESAALASGLTAVISAAQNLLLPAPSSD